MTLLNFFTLSGSMSVKAVCRTLVKLTPDVIEFKYAMPQASPPLVIRMAMSALFRSMLKFVAKKIHKNDCQCFFIII